VFFNPLFLYLHSFSSCSAELISTAYQPWNSVFFSQQISHSRLISQKTAYRTGPFYLCVFFFLFCIAQFFQTGALAAITIKPASFRLIEHTCVRVGSHVAEEIHHSFYILS
jgi:hypothetical protein